MSLFTVLMRYLKSVFSDGRHSSEHGHFIFCQFWKKISMDFERISLIKKLEAFSFLNPFRTEKLTSVRSWVTWVKLARICRRLDERRGWAACASLASQNIINQWCSMKASWENELPSYSTHQQQPRCVSHRSEHNTSCVWITFLA